MLVITTEQKRRFVELACSLSPENLSCDGELSRSQVQAKYRRLDKEWKKIEAEVGRKVSEDEAWNFTDDPDYIEKYQ